MYAILPAREGLGLVFQHCDICGCNVGKFEDIINHYKTTHRKNQSELNKIRDNRIRKELNLPLINFQMITCEICSHHLDDREEIYFLHLIEYHRPEEILAKVKNTQYVNLLKESGCLNITCELCNEELTSECGRKEYINHILSRHPDELKDYKIVKKVKDINVISKLLLNTKSRTPVDEKKVGGLIENIMEEDDFFNDVIGEVKEEDSKFPCEVCTIPVENSIEIYLSHLLSSHHFGCMDQINPVMQVILNEYLNFSCEICGNHIGPHTFNYSKHLAKQHADLGLNLLIYVKDKLFFANAVRIILREGTKISQNNDFSEIDSFSQLIDIDQFKPIRVISNKTENFHQVTPEQTNFQSVSKLIIPPKRHCEVCSEEVEIDYYSYAVHLSCHTKDQIIERVSNPVIAAIGFYGVFPQIKCEICSKEMPEIIEDYIHHLNNYHKGIIQQNPSAIKDKFIKDLIIGQNNKNYTPSYSNNSNFLNSHNNSISDSLSSLSFEQLQARIKSYSELPERELLKRMDEVSYLIDYAEKKFGAGLNTVSITNTSSNISSSSNNTDSYISESQKDSNNSNLISETIPNKNKKEDITGKVKLLENLKSLDDSFYKDEIESLEGEIKSLSQAIVKSHNSINVEKAQNQTEKRNEDLQGKMKLLENLLGLNDSFYNDEIAALEQEIQKLSGSVRIDNVVENSKFPFTFIKITNNSNEFRLVSSFFKQGLLKDIGRKFITIVNIFSIDNSIWMKESFIHLSDSDKCLEEVLLFTNIFQEKANIELLNLLIQKERIDLSVKPKVSLSNRYDEMIKFSLLTKNNNYIITLSSVYIQRDRLNENNIHLTNIDKFQTLPVYIIEYRLD